MIDSIECPTLSKVSKVQELETAIWKFTASMVKKFQLEKKRKILKVRKKPKLGN